MRGVSEDWIFLFDLSDCLDGLPIEIISIFESEKVTNGFYYVFVKVLNYSKHSGEVIRSNIELLCYIWWF